MATLLESHPELPQRNFFTENLIWLANGGEPVQIKMKKEYRDNDSLIHISDNVVTQSDPGFINADKKDFRLKSNSPVWKTIPNFPQIETSKIGLFIDEYRKGLPSPAEMGKLPEQDPWKPSEKENKFST